jgi:hypothetical protein
MKIGFTSQELLCGAEKKKLEWNIYVTLGMFYLHYVLRLYLYLCALWLSENLIKYIFFTSVKENMFQYFSSRVFCLRIDYIEGKN